MDSDGYLPNPSRQEINLGHRLCYSGPLTLQRARGSSKPVDNDLGERPIMGIGLPLRDLVP